jgi:CheY-like chemotaxis protein
MASGADVESLGLMKVRHVSCSRGWQEFSYDTRPSRLRSRPRVLRAVCRPPAAIEPPITSVDRVAVALSAATESLAESLGMIPLSQGKTFKVLVSDDEPAAVELIAVYLLGTAKYRAAGVWRPRVDRYRAKELPDLIVLDLMMPDVNGFDVVEALRKRRDTARIPIVVVTAKQVTAEDRAKLHGFATTIMEKTAFDRDRFTAEIRRAMSGRQVVA